MRDFIVAMSGAVIGAMSTLLLLFILNGGTLQFASKIEVEELEASLTRVDENLGTLVANVDTLSDRVDAPALEAPVPKVEVRVVEATATEVPVAPETQSVGFKVVPYQDLNGNNAMDPGEERPEATTEVMFQRDGIVYSSLDGSFVIPVGSYGIQFRGVTIPAVLIDISKDGTEFPIKID